MNNLIKNKIFSIVIVILLLANIATMIVFWTKKDKQMLPPHNVKGGVAEFLSTELSFDSTQKLAYATLREEHQEKIKEIREESRNAKDALFDLLKQSSVKDDELQKALNDIAENEKTLDKQTFHHFQKVRALCNDEQKKKFDEVIQQALRMMGPPPGGRRGGPPPPNGERPQGPPPMDGEHDRPPPPNEQ
jgi:flagellar motility protein MotE (MotC chaperone)